MNTLLKLGLVSMAVSGAILNAQGTGGNITGQVVDPSGLGVPGTRIAAMNLETNVSPATTSSASGNYNISVYPGNYRVTAEAQGFKRYLLSSVTVTASSTIRVDAVLELGSGSEWVQVS